MACSQEVPHPARDRITVRTTRPRGALWRVLAATIILLAVAPATAWSAESTDRLETASSAVPVPEGFKQRVSEQIAPGLSHAVLVRERPPLVVHVARLVPGVELELRSVLSGDTVAGESPRLERTSSMCARIDCLVAVNGDFFTLESQTPLGAFVSNGRMVTSPNSSHHQLSITRDGKLEAGNLGWRGRLVTTDLEETSFDGINVARRAGQLILYTPDYGRSTQTNSHGVELVVRLVEGQALGSLSETALIEMLEFREDEGDTPIPADGAVLSGHDAGAEKLRALWQAKRRGEASTRAMLRIETGTDVVQSVGGTPILLRNGRQWFADEPDGFVRGRHPRTAVGWDDEGSMLLVTVDGRQSGYSVGASLAELAHLMATLGASEAFNLDGGGSTTFVVDDEVRNRPSDRAVRDGDKIKVVYAPGEHEELSGNVERPVVAALAIVPKRAGDPVAPSDPLGSGAGLPEPLYTDPPAQPDPGSVPAGRLPALVVATGDTESDEHLLIVAALLFNLYALGAVGVRKTALARAEGVSEH